VERVDNRPGVPRPARTAVDDRTLALAALLIGGTMPPTLESIGERVRRGIRANFRSVREVSRSGRIDHSSRDTDAKVMREVAVGPQVFPHDSKLAGWQPVRDMRSLAAHGHDIPQVIQRLQVAGVMPTEVAVTLRGENANERSDPTGIGERVEPPLHRGNRAGEPIRSGASVARRAGRSRYLPKSGTRPALERRERVGRTRHLSGSREPADDTLASGGIVGNFLADGMERDRIGRDGFGGTQGEGGGGEHGGILP